ncbi:MAG TPA: hypothetical protein VH092_17705, partial [Urbifossiella sp.]|nr:hypothetical protein [Urbifossiella sp.]
PNRILITKNGRLMLIDPDGKNASPVTTDGESPRSGRLSPDGRTVAYVAHLMDVPPAPEGIRQIEQRLFVRRADGTGAATDLGVAAESFAWSADGSRIATTDFVKRGGELTAVHKLVDVAVKTAADLPVPADHILTDWSRDGRFFLTQQFRPSDPEGVLPTIRIRLLNRDGTDDKLTNAATRLLLNGRLSPDGRRVLCEQARLPPDPTGKWPPRRPVVLDLVTGVVTSLADFPPNGEMFGFCWSPDGRRVAFAWHPAGDIDPTLPPLESSLVVCDADGRNSATVATAKGLLPIGSALLVEDWR